MLVAAPEPLPTGHEHGQAVTGELVAQRGNPFDEIIGVVEDQQCFSLSEPADNCARIHLHHTCCDGDRADQLVDRGQG